MIASEGWKTCKVCGKEYYLEEEKFPFKDDEHTVCCPYCGKESWIVEKGTYDFNAIKKEDINRGKTH